MALADGALAEVGIVGTLGQRGHAGSLRADHLEPDSLALADGALVEGQEELTIRDVLTREEAVGQDGVVLAKEGILEGETGLHERRGHLDLANTAAVTSVEELHEGLAFEVQDAGAQTLGGGAVAFHGEVKAGCGSGLGIGGRAVVLASAFIDGIEVRRTAADARVELEVLVERGGAETGLTHEQVGVIGGRHHHGGAIERLDHDGVAIVLERRDGQVVHREARAVVILGREGLHGTRREVGIEDGHVDRAAVELDVGDHFEVGDGALVAGTVALGDHAFHEDGRVDLVLLHLALDVILRAGSEGSVGKENAKKGEGEERNANHDLR